MVGYILRKLIYGILVLWGVVTLVFAIFSINPGDPARMLLGQRVDEASLAAVNRELGLDLPKGEQYLLYLNDISPVSIHETENETSHLYLDSAKYDYTSLFSVGAKTVVLKYPYLRRSYQSRKPVSDVIAEALPGTVILALFAITFALIFGILFGVVSAIYKGSFLDNFSLFSAVLGMSTPSFFSAIILSWLGGYLWSAQVSLPALPFVFLLLGIAFTFFGKHKKSGVRYVSNGLKGLVIGLALTLVGGAFHFLFGFSIIPFSGGVFHLPGTGLNMTGSLYDVDVFTGEYLAMQNLILPVITLGIRPLAIVMQLTRNSLLEQLSQDYVRTARAKGLSETRVIFGHALRNALNPVVTAISGWFASMLAGAVFIEFIFNWKGLGLQVFQSLQNDDYPVVMGSVLVIAAAFVLINIFVDIIYGWLDPRIRLK